jgi:hypothetical protein
MAAVAELQPGDLVTQGGESAIFISAVPHPNYRGLQLVIWHMNTTGAGGKWSLDALSPRQEVGEVTPATAGDRWQRIQEAFSDTADG